MKTISLLNLKGGVAKSFSAVNIAYELWRRYNVPYKVDTTRRRDYGVLGIARENYIENAGT